MNSKSVILKKEIREISNYRALIISKYYILILLAIVSFYLGLLRYAVSSLYILIFLLVLPPIFTSALMDYAKRYQYKFLINITKDLPFQLSNLKKKYKFSHVKYLANQISYLISLLLMGLWQFNYSSTENMNEFLLNIPFLILSTGFALRILCVIYYQIKLPYDLLHNKV